MRRLLLCLLAVALAGCAGVDQDQARLCRIAIPALHPPGVGIEITALERGGAPHSVIIRHEVRRGPAPPRERTAECRFSGGFLSLNRLELVELKLDGRPLPDATLLFLRRFWIDDPAVARLQPPRSAADLAHALSVPPAFAVPLQHAVLATPQIAIYALLAPAFALVYGLIGRINLAFGELVVIGGQGALVGMVLGGMLGGGAPLAMLGFALALGLAAGATHADAMARSVIGPLARSGGQPLLVATAGLSAALMEYVRLAQGSGPRWSPPLLGTPVLLADGGGFAVTITEGGLLAAGLALAASAALLAAMRWSRFGREWRATAEEPVAAALLGVDTAGVLARAMAIGGLLAGLAGFIVTAHYGGVGFSGGLGIGLKALIAAILGGVGSVGGAMAGAVLLGVFEAAWAALLPLHLREGAVFGLLILLLMFRPGGILGFAGRDPARDGDMR
jgi:branched-subunit amino acid ABC-type transport system permease component